MFGYGQTVTVYPPVTQDRTGDPTAASVPYTISNVGIAWDATSEDADHRISAISEVRLLMPPGTAIALNSKVALPDGDLYLMVGKPSRPHNPITGWEPGVVVRLKAVVS